MLIIGWPVELDKPRSGDAVSHEPSLAASSSAPAAAARGSVPMAVSSSSADERFPK